MFFLVSTECLRAHARKKMTPLLIISYLGWICATPPTVCPRVCPAAPSSTVHTPPRAAHVPPAPSPSPGWGRRILPRPRRPRPEAVIYRGCRFRYIYAARSPFLICHQVCYHWLLKTNYRLHYIPSEQYITYLANNTLHT